MKRREVIALLVPLVGQAILPAAGERRRPRLAMLLVAASETSSELKRQLAIGKPRAAIAQTVDKIADLLAGGGNLVYSGYPYDPFASPTR